MSFKQGYRKQAGVPAYRPMVMTEWDRINSDHNLGINEKYFHYH